MVRTHRKAHTFCFELDEPGSGGVGQREDGEERQQLQVRQVHQDPFQPVGKARRYVQYTILNVHYEFFKNLHLHIFVCIYKTVF